MMPHYALLTVRPTDTQALVCNLTPGSGHTQCALAHCLVIKAMEHCTFGREPLLYIATGLIVQPWQYAYDRQYTTQHKHSASVAQSAHIRTTLPTISVCATDGAGVYMLVWAAVPPIHKAGHPASTSHKGTRSPIMACIMASWHATSETSNSKQINMAETSYILVLHTLHLNMCQFISSLQNGFAILTVRYSCTPCCICRLLVRCEP